MSRAMTAARVGILSSQAEEIGSKVTAALDLAAEFSSIKLKSRGPIEPSEAMLPKSGGTTKDALTYAGRRMETLIADPSVGHDVKKAMMRKFVAIQALDREFDEGASQFNANVKHFRTEEALDAQKARAAAQAEEQRQAQLQKAQDFTWLPRAEFQLKYPEG